MRSLAEQAAIDVVFWMILVTGLLIVAVQIVGRLMDRSGPKIRRARGRISERERQLVGDDYRVHVVEFAQKVERRRQIVREITGAGRVSH